MIPLIEVKEKAAEQGVPETTVIKDYALSWILKALYQLSDSLALKGGTGIRKAYIENYRFSIDLDFTLTKQLDLKALLEEAAALAREESGIEFEEKIAVRSSKSGYEARLSFKLYYRYPMIIKIDATAPENELIVLPLERRKLIHPYSDHCEATLLVYKLEEIFAEKTRSLFERTRPRDLYDVWYLSKIVNLEATAPLIARKLEFKGIELKVERFVEKKEAYRGAWHSSLRNQLKNLPSFNQVFNEVEGLLKAVFEKTT
ncbi:MAG: nucleotidyl transferase AbiEii/AbiGii toxin family protein [Candidatus Verstraetearchaeota archaeon]|nr:nucleotidyl transferase AbiEii/AbiGii toxin family protein [Candidatus Verstraetearchaeota archaeon]